MKSELLEKKNKLRKFFFNERKKLFSSTYEIFDEALFEKLFQIVNSNNMNFISSFISIKTEINTTQLNNYILKKNKTLCFPVVLKKDQHLIFRKFTDETNLVEGFMNIKEPPIKNPIIIPELLFVPCLAFDTCGFRLGYGGGYYDRTFKYLKKNNNKYISVGYAFDGQKVSELPKDKFDIKLDYVITEKKIYSFI